MMNVAIASILIKKYNNYKIYVHNLSNFDGIFLLKILASLKNCFIKPIIKDGKMINIELTSYKIKINFRDSLLMLPLSLRKLAITFKVENKGIFPYLFVNDPNVKLNYNGPIPSFDKFVNLSREDYDSYSKNLINN